MRDILTVRNQEEMDAYKEFVKAFKQECDIQLKERGFTRTLIKQKCLKCGIEFEDVEKLNFCFDCHCENHE
jgi:predicted Zn-ribbon and HTH transcriptional regulator